MLSDKWRRPTEGIENDYDKGQEYCADELIAAKASALENFDRIERAYRLENGLGVAYKDSYLEMIGKLRNELEDI